MNHYPDTSAAHCVRTMHSPIRRAYEGELAAIVSYTANSILLEPYLAGVSKLYREISITEMEHFRHVGELLRDIGASPYPNMRAAPRIYYFNEDADSHAIVVAKRMLSESVASERHAIKEYARFSENADDRAVKKLFAMLAAEESEHLREFEEMHARLCSS